MRDEDVVMTLLESLRPSYEYLITALETLPMQDLTMVFVTARLTHEVSKRREKEPQGDDATTKDGDHFKAIYKWIMDSGATKHMTPHRAAFDTYEVIPTCNVHMGDDSIVEAIGMGSILEITKVIFK